MNWKIPLFKIHWDESDVKSVNEVIRRGNYWTMGPEIQQLEKKIQDFIGARYALTFNSGTSCLHAILLAHEIDQMEVITPSFSFISTANAIILAGGKPVFAEIEEKSYGLDPEDVKEKITKKTKAIMPVHYGGSPCKEIAALRDIAQDHNLILIEDAAESLGAHRNDKMVGTFGDAAVFSFCQNKIITGGEGGVVVSDDKKTIEKLQLIRSHGRQENKEGYFSTSKGLKYTDIGYNYRMSSLTASLILSQLRRISTIIQKRTQLANEYTINLNKLPGIHTPSTLKKSSHVYQLYTIRFEENTMREKVKKNLEKEGIMSKIYFKPIHLEQYYQSMYGFSSGVLPVTEHIADTVLTLPLYPDLSCEELTMICDCIKITLEA